MQEVFLTGNSNLSRADLPTGAKQTEIDSKLGTIESDIEALNTALGTLETAVNAVETAVAANETDVEAVKTAVDTVNTNLGTLETDVEAVKTAVDTLISWQCTDLLAGPDELTVTVSSQTLVELGLTLNDNLRKITLIPASTGIFWADGATTAGTNPLPAAGVEIICSKDEIATREFIVSSGTIKLQVVQEG